MELLTTGDFNIAMFYYGYLICFEYPNTFSMGEYHKNMNLKSNEKKTKKKTEIVFSTKIKSKILLYYYISFS